MTCSFSYSFSTCADGGAIATHVLTALQDFSMVCETKPKSFPVLALSNVYVCIWTSLRKTTDAFKTQKATKLYSKATSRCKTQSKTMMDSVVLLQCITEIYLRIHTHIHVHIHWNTHILMHMHTDSDKHIYHEICWFCRFFVEFLRVCRGSATL